MHTRGDAVMQIDAGRIRIAGRVFQALAYQTARCIRREAKTQGRAVNQRVQEGWILVDRQGKRTPNSAGCRRLSTGGSACDQRVVRHEVVAPFICAA